MLTEKLVMHYIQLSKFKKQCKTISSKLDEWLTFILNEDKGAIRNMKNEKIQKAEDELEYLTGDAATRRIAELREKAIRDEMAGLKSATRRGIEMGLQRRNEETESKNGMQERKKRDCQENVREKNRFENDNGLYRPNRKGN